MAYAKSLGYTVIQGEYDSDLWKAAVGEKCGVFPLIESALDYAENLKKRRNRCRACFAFRFEALAEVARQQRFRTIATTLSVSPYQFTDILREELQEAAHRHSLESLFVDFREFYPETVKLSRALGMYRQKYCGCLDSKKEAELEHLARAEAKKRARTQKIKDTDEH
jgi:predicted adenine nucleotide alpha hydrolase (AANH) superfamily ATPase